MYHLLHALSVFLYFIIWREGQRSEDNFHKSVLSFNLLGQDLSASDWDLHIPFFMFGPEIKLKLSGLLDVLVSIL